MKTIQLFAILVLSVCAVWGRDTQYLPLSMAHRGDGVFVPGRVNRPDNSLEACLFAWANHVIPEADIRRTKDNMIIAYHNSKLNGRPIEEYDEHTCHLVHVGSGRSCIPALQQIRCCAPFSLRRSYC